MGTVAITPTEARYRELLDAVEGSLGEPFAVSLDNTVIELLCEAQEVLDDETLLELLTSRLAERAARVAELESEA